MGISKFLKLKRIKEIETMLSVKLPEDYKTFLLENNGAINCNYTLSFKVKELDAEITLDVILGIDTNNNADLLRL